MALFVYDDKSYIRILFNICNITYVWSRGVGQFVNYCFKPDCYNMYNVYLICIGRERERELYTIMISKQSTAAL